jgi:hypothetical protein
MFHFNAFTFRLRTLGYIVLLSIYFKIFHKDPIKFSL